MSDNTTPPKGNATVVELPSHPELQAIADALKQVMEANEEVGIVLMFRVMKDGSVRPTAASRILNPTEVVPSLVKLGADTLQEGFHLIRTRGDQCNCETCIERRGGVYMEPSIKAEA